MEKEALEQPLAKNVEYFDATEAIKAIERKIEKQDATIQRIATLLQSFAKRQVEMRADLLAAGAFEKKSAIIMPGKVN